MNDVDSVASDLAGEIPPRLAAKIETLGHRMATACERVGRIIFGQQCVIDQTLIMLLAGGHALLVGLLGLGALMLAWCRESQSPQAREPYTSQYPCGIERYFDNLRNSACRSEVL